MGHIKFWLFVLQFWWHTCELIGSQGCIVLVRYIIIMFYLLFKFSLIQILFFYPFFCCSCCRNYCWGFLGRRFYVFIFVVILVICLIVLYDYALIVWQKICLCLALKNFNNLWGLSTRLLSDVTTYMGGNKLFTLFCLEHYENWNYHSLVDLWVIWLSKLLTWMISLFYSFMQEPFKSIPLIWTIHERILAVRSRQYTANGQIALVNDWKRYFNRATVVVFPNYFLPVIVYYEVSHLVDIT